MDKGSCNGDHLPMNQSLPKIAPYPTQPAASEEIGNGSPTRRQQKTVPIPWLEEFEPPRQIQVKFSIKPYRMVISEKAESRLIMRRRKVRPEGTTLQACWRLPIKDSSSFRVQWRLSDQETRSAWIQSNFSCGRCTCNRRESSSMPRTVRTVERPSNLSGWRGIPNPEIAGYRCLSSVGTSEN